MKKAENTQEKLALKIIEKMLPNLEMQTILQIIFAIIYAVRGNINLIAVAMAVLGDPILWTPKKGYTKFVDILSDRTNITHRNILEVNQFKEEYSTVEYEEATETICYCKTQKDADKIKEKKYILGSVEISCDKNETFPFEVRFISSPRSGYCSTTQWESWENNTPIPTTAVW